MFLFSFLTSLQAQVGIFELCRCQAHHSPMRFRSWTLLTWAHLRLSWERRTLLSWDLSILERRNMACLFSGLDGACTCWIFFSGRGCSVARRITFRETFPHHASLPSLSLRTSFASYFAQLRSVRACSGSSLQLHSIWSFSLGLRFGSLRIGIFTVCFGLYSFRELSLSQRLSVLWLRLVFVHEFDCELILCRVPLIWVRRCHSSLLIDLVHL